MSLRKPPRLTPRLLAATRQNAQHSTGPRRAAGKQNSKLNALKHGERAKPENHRQVALALGEDPEEFDSIDRKVRILLALRKELASGNLPGTAAEGDNHPNMDRAGEAVECPSARHSPEKLPLRLATGGNPSSCGLAHTPTDAGMTRRGEASPRPYNVAAPHAGLTTPDENTKMNERSGNVIENKGPLWKTPEAGSNLLENKGDTCIIRECY
jgi:hypothetical protein